MVSGPSPRPHSQEGTSHTSNEWIPFPPTPLSFSHVWERHSQACAQAALQYHHPLCCSLCPQRSIWMLSRAHHFPALQFAEYQTLFLPAQLNHSSLPWSSSPASITVTPSYLASDSHMFSSLSACSNHSCQNYLLSLIVWKHLSLPPKIHRDLPYPVFPFHPTRHIWQQHVHVLSSGPLPYILNFISYCGPLLFL